MNKTGITAITALMASLAMTAYGQETPSQLGQRLFDGTEPLIGSIRHVDEQLPPSVVACKSCHQVGCSAGWSEPNAPPALGPVHLLSKIKRISGPAVAYDAASFCRVLETGRTPAHTITARAMPQFTMDEESCVALWTYLTGESHDCEGS